MKSHRSFYSALSLVLLFQSPLLASSSLDFAGPSTISPSGNDGAAATEGADFDGDGRIEFVSAGTRSTSDAHFRLFDYNVTTESYDVISIRSDEVIQQRQDRFGGDLTPADINDDGWIDIVVPESNNNNGPGQVSWFENPAGNLDGAWTEHVVEIWTGSSESERVAHMSEVDVGDIDGNGKLDIVTRDVRHGVFLMLQKADGSGWEPRRFIATNPREGLDLFDPDNDGDLDIILNGIWLETPSDPLNGTYIEHTYGAAWYPSGGSSAQISDYASQIAVVDFNNDGRMDIAISNSEELANDSSTDVKPKGIDVYLAPLDPKTEAWTRVDVENQHFSWHSLEPADLNCDGAMDFISAISSVGRDNAPEEIVYFLNGGDGLSFTKVDLISTNVPFVYNSTVGDSDGDGDVDFFAPNNFNSGPIRLFENTSTIQTTPPSNAPGNVSATALSSTSVQLTWQDNNTDEDGFRVERKLAGEAFVEVYSSSANVTFWLDEDLSQESDYTYRIYAFNSIGDSPASEEVTVTTPAVDNTPPSAPQSLSSAMITTAGFSLSWAAATDNVGVSGYRIYRGEILIQELTTLSTTITGLASGVNYQFTVSAIDEEGNESPRSESLSVMTTSAPSADEFLLAYWPMDEIAQEFTVFDEVSNRAGALSGQGISSGAAGRYSRALAISNSSSRVTVPSFDILGDQLTLSAWIRLDSFAGEANEARFISKASGTSNEDHDWMLGNTANGSALRFRLKTDNNGTILTETLISPLNVISLNEWIHVAATYDGTQMRLFTNGTQVASMPKSGNIPASTYLIGLGNQPDQAGNRGISGLLDEVRIYDQALTDLQLKQISFLPEPIYQQWISSYLTPTQLLDSSLSDPTGDADSNGVVNLIDFATERSPLEENRSFSSQLSSMTGEAVFSYSRLKGGVSLPGGRYRFGNITYQPEASDDLSAGSWDFGDSVYGVLGTPVDNGDGTETIFLNTEGSSAASEMLFYRLRIELE